MSRELRPSGADTWMLCVGSPALVESLNLEDDSSPYAALGTAAHELAAKCLEESIDPRSQRGEIITVDGFECEIDANMTDAVGAYVQDISRRAYGNTLMVEQPVEITNIVGQKRIGTSDAIILPSHTTEPLEIHDYKHGEGIEVFAEKNRQMLLYGIGFFESNPFLDPPEKVKLVIHQPRIKSAPDSWTVKYSQLMKFAELAKKKAKLALSLEPLEGLKPGAKQCQWCRAKGACPALDEIAASVFDDIDEAIETILLPDDPRLLSERYKKLPMVQLWLEAIKKLVYSKMSDGDTIPDFKFVRGRKGNRKWKSAKKAAEELKKLRVKRDVLYNQTLATPAAIQNHISHSQYEKLDALGMILQGEGNLTVVPTSDNRQEVFKSDVFDNIEGD